MIPKVRKKAEESKDSSYLNNGKIEKIEMKRELKNGKIREMTERSK